MSPQMDEEGALLRAEFRVFLNTANIVEIVVILRTISVVNFVNIAIPVNITNMSNSGSNVANVFFYEMSEATHG